MLAVSQFYALRGDSESSITSSGRFRICGEKRVFARHSGPGLTRPPREVEDKERASLLHPLKGAASMPLNLINPNDSLIPPQPIPDGAQDLSKRSEERRVGKECRSRWSPY